MEMGRWMERQRDESGISRWMGGWAGGQRYGHGEGWMKSGETDGWQMARWL